MEKQKNNAEIISGQLEDRVIQPFYNVDGICLYKADCRTIMQSLPPVQWTITDPPFNANHGFSNDNLTKQEFNDFTADWISKAEAITTEGFILPDYGSCLQTKISPIKFGA